MGHRRNSQPRRGSLAYLPRGRAKSMEARVRQWADPGPSEPKLLAYAGFKAGCVQLVSIDDREHTPNRGKQLVSLGTIISTPPILVVGMRGYSRDARGIHAEFDAYAPDLPKEVSKRIELKSRPEIISAAEKRLGRMHKLCAIVAAFPYAAGLEQKTPYIFEAPVSGGDIQAQFEYIRGLMGSQVKVADVFEPGSGVDVAAITKGKGWQGVITRYGAKKKQHKSRKTVRELGSLGPISPQYVMYTVPRAGQMGFHQRIEYNKRIMVMDSSEGPDSKINPQGGYKHFGNVKGDYVILKGSVPGTYRRMIKMRPRIRSAPAKSAKPNILEVVV